MNSQTLSVQPHPVTVCAAAGERRRNGSAAAITGVGTAPGEERVAARGAISVLDVGLRNAQRRQAQQRHEAERKAEQRSSLKAAARKAEQRSRRSKRTRLNVSDSLASLSMLGVWAMALEPGIVTL